MQKSIKSFLKQLFKYFVLGFFLGRPPTQRRIRKDNETLGKLEEDIQRKVQTIEN
jgi:hypothetical protein